MQTLIAISDTHGNRAAIDELFPLFAENDIIVHLGDTSADGNYIRNKFPAKTHVINGNCETSPIGDDEEIITVEAVKILLCHGHKYSVKHTLFKLAERARELGCQIALYGHTHDARVDEIDGVTLINPGACTRYGAKSYLYLAIHGKSFTHKIVPFGN